MGNVSLGTKNDMIFIIGGSYLCLGPNKMSIRQGARLPGQGAHARSVEAKEVYRTVPVYRLKHPHIERGLMPIVLHVR